MEGGALRSRLQRLGVIRSSGHEHFNGSLVVPVHDEAGAVVELYGRKVTAKLRKGTPVHLYLPSPHRGVFNVEALAAGDEVILCESLIDAMTFWAAGFRHVTASYGIEGFGDEHVEAFRRHGTTRVLIAYDRDPAGDRAAAALAERLMAMGIECFRVLFPAGTDANDVARGSASPTDALGAAAWMGRSPGPFRARLPGLPGVDEPGSPLRQRAHRPSATPRSSRSLSRASTVSRSQPRPRRCRLPTTRTSAVPTTGLRRRDDDRPDHRQAPALAWGPWPSPSPTRRATLGPWGQFSFEDRLGLLVDREADARDSRRPATPAQGRPKRIEY